MKYEEVLAAVAKGGDVEKSKEIYLRAGCIACHTTGPDEPPKGPMLALAAKIYDRATLTESVLKPNAKLAQGFESAWFKNKKANRSKGSSPAKAATPWTCATSWDRDGDDREGRHCRTRHA